MGKNKETEATAHGNQRTYMKWVFHSEKSKTEK